MGKERIKDLKCPSSWDNKVEKRRIRKKNEAFGSQPENEGDNSVSNSWMRQNITSLNSEKAYQL